MANKKKIIVLANENKDDHILWIKSLELYQIKIDYLTVFLSEDGWLKKILDYCPDYCLSRPPGITTIFKQLYDERLYIISKILKIPIYPCYEECLIYENKRFLASWLEANNIPHPLTNVFYHIDEAKEYIRNSQYPKVAKINIGASGSGVKLLNSEKEAWNYIKQVFYGKGAPKRWGPNTLKEGLIKRGLYYINHPGKISKKIKIYNTRRLETQKGFVIFQEYIKHNFEWRVVRIGDSFFAHKKIKKGDKTSGSLLKKYDNPPLLVLDFVKELTDRFSFRSQAVDLFEISEGNYLVNEMQCIFGQSDPYQMLVDGKPGRYIFKNNVWEFESGNFNRNESFNLRVEWLLNNIK